MKVSCPLKLTRNPERYHTRKNTFSDVIYFVVVMNLLLVLFLWNCVVVFFVWMLQIKLPYLLQGILASIGDLFLFRLSRRLSGHAVAQWTLLCSLLSWFMAYCCTRTLTNSTEMVLVTMALYYFPWPSLPG